MGVFDNKIAIGFCAHTREQDWHASTVYAPYLVNLDCSVSVFTPTCKVRATVG